MKQGDIIFYQFSRASVELGDFTDFTSRFGIHQLPQGRRLARMMNNMVPFFEGYDGDFRELYAIPEVRAVARSLSKQWPYWLYFGNLQTESLMMFVLCTVPSLESTAFKGTSKVRVVVDPQDLLNFVAEHLPSMNEMCARAQLAEQEVYERTKMVFEYFNLPFLG